MTKSIVKQFQCPRHWSLSQRLAHSSAAPNERGCTVWTRATKEDGYGMMKWQGKMQKTHRLAWVSVNGPIPDGMHVLHTCDVPNCINANHLWLGTNADNMADMDRKGRRKKGPRRAHL